VLGTDLPYQTTLPVLGVNVALRSNARELIDAFEETLGPWRALEGRLDLISTEQVRGALVLSDDREGEGPEPPVSYRISRPDRLVISTPGSLAVSDAARREFTGSVTRELLSSGAHFRGKVLEAMVLAVVTWLDRQPLHASAVVRGGTALLLAGPSGTGKSTLAYAAARTGLAVLSEDTVFIQLEPRLRVWGVPHTVHLPPDARRYFPELAGEPTRVLATGKQKVALRLAELGAASTALVLERAGICVMERSAGAPARYEPMSPRELEVALVRSREPGFDLFDNARAGVAGALCAGGAWCLTLADPPQDTVPLLHELLDQVDARLGR
jgi:hypothetical protein